jgi:type II secretory pathway pseudopilin PulG
MERSLLKKPLLVLLAVVVLSAFAGTSSAAGRYRYRLRQRVNREQAGSVNQQVLAYAAQHLGQTVNWKGQAVGEGQGTCYDLAYAALNSAGAHLPWVPPYGQYEFGMRVSVYSVVPGDVVQFDNVQWKTGLPTAQHTAIVVKLEGQVLTVIDQNNRNGDGHLYPKYDTFNLGDWAGGSIQGFRPQPR